MKTIDKELSKIKPLTDHISKCWLGYLIGFTGYGMVIDGLIHKNSEEVYAGLGISALGGIIGYNKDTKIENNSVEIKE